MEESVRLNACVAHHPGLQNGNGKDNFYINGRYKYEYETGNIQVSVDSSNTEFILAVCNQTDAEVQEKNFSTSTVKELSRFQERTKNNPGNLANRIIQLKDCIDEANGIIHSQTLNNPERKSAKTVFSGLLVIGSRAAAIYTHGGRVYFMRDGRLNLITADYKKTEKLLKMGIITNEQAEALSRSHGNPSGGNIPEAQSSQIIEIEEGDKFLLCGGSSSYGLDDATIEELMLSGEDPGYVANTLVKEALNSGCKDDITVLVAKVDRMPEQAPTTIYIEENQRSNRSGRPAAKSRSGQKRRLTFFAALFACMLIFGIALLAYNSFNKNSNRDDKTDYRNTAQNTPAQNSDIRPTISDNAGVDRQAGKDIKIDGSGTDGGNPAVPEETAKPDNVKKASVKYKVQAGDTLYSIGKKFYSSPKKYSLIMEYNNIKDPNRIFAGQTLVIPEPDK